MDVIDFFEDYTSNFDKNIDGIKLKYSHSYRVMNIALGIAKNLELSNEDVANVRVCALLHDIGRFIQYTKYKSFNDKETFDHGDKGYEILKEKGFTDDKILNTVRYHNKLLIPNDLDDKTKLYLKIIRDSDKLDIMKTQELICTTKNYKIGKDIVELFSNHQLINRDITLDCEGNLLSILRMLAFIFDINYKESIEIIKKEDFVNKKCDLIYKNNKYEEINEIRDTCNKYIESRL